MRADRRTLLGAGAVAACAAGGAFALTRTAPLPPGDLDGEAGDLGPQAPLPLDALSPESAAADLRIVDLSWLNALAVEPEGLEPPVAAVVNRELETATQPAAVESHVEVEPERSLDEMSLEELEFATRPDSASGSFSSVPVERVGARPEAPAPPAPESATTIEEPRLVAPLPVVAASAEEGAQAVQSVQEITVPAPDVVRPAVVEPAAAVALPERDPKPSRTSKSSRKKRKHSQGQAVPATPTPKIVAVETDFGFFDPHKHGFMPLVARLNELTGGGIPLR